LKIKDIESDVVFSETARHKLIFIK